MATVLIGDPTGVAEVLGATAVDGTGVADVRADDPAFTWRSSMTAAPTTTNRATIRAARNRAATGFGAGRGRIGIHLPQW